MSQELVRRPQPTLEETYRVAKGFAMSGYFPDAKSAEQALVKIMAGGEMGLLPFQSMNGIDIIKGRPVLKPALLAGILDASPDYDYETAWEPDQANAIACTITIYKGGKKRGDSRFSLEDAARAELAGKENYQKYPPNMLRERAMGNAVRWYAPGLIMGPAYVEGEVVPDPLPPHIEALNNQPSPESIIDIDVTPYVAPDDPLDDVPFEPAAPADDKAESQVGPGQFAAEPAAPPGGGLLIDSVDAAERVIRAMSEPQLKALKKLLGTNLPVTKKLLAQMLFDQYGPAAKGGAWYAEDILKEIA